MLPFWNLKELKDTCFGTWQSAVDCSSQQLSSMRLKASRDNTEGILKGVNTREDGWMHGEANKRRILISLIVDCIIKWKLKSLIGFGYNIAVSTYL